MTLNLEKAKECLLKMEISTESPTYQHYAKVLLGSIKPALISLVLMVGVVTFLTVFQELGLINHVDIWGSLVAYPLGFVLMAYWQFQSNWPGLERNWAEMARYFRFPKVPSTLLWSVSVLSIPLVVPIIARLTGDPGGGSSFNDMSTAHQTGWWAVGILILTSCIAVPLVEEYVSRHLVLDRLRLVFGGVAAVIISAILFALGHVLYLGHPTGIIQVFLLGLIAGGARVQTKSLWGAIAVHSTYNSAVTIALFHELLK
ncbi:MAG: lysostaphin resistance A-like protein [Gammaproteobacteria bacterium]